MGGVVSSVENFTPWPLLTYNMEVDVQKCNKVCTRLELCKRSHRYNYISLKTAREYVYERQLNGGHVV